MDTIISCENLTHYYGKKCIYEGLNFSVPRGRILGLLGKNGTGKTTTINILMGFLKPQSGKCRIFGEEISSITPDTRRRIALLLENHVQYQFMTIEQIEKFYSKFYPSWNAEAYYELMGKMDIAPRQKISMMSNGQRSQVALGLVLAQNADLLVFDDFSLGLDPGYRRLFSDYLHEYAKAENKTVFLTSHIVQDIERLVDDCIIMDYGKILVQKSLKDILNTLRYYKFTTKSTMLPEDEKIFHPSVYRGCGECVSFEKEEYIRNWLKDEEISDLNVSQMNLEDAFIGLTGKY